MYQSRLVQEVRLPCYPKEKFKLPVTTRFYSRSGWGVGGGGGVGFGLSGHSSELSRHQIVVIR